MDILHEPIDVLPEPVGLSDEDLDKIAGGWGGIHNSFNNNFNGVANTGVIVDSFNVIPL